MARTSANTTTVANRKKKVRSTPITAKHVNRDRGNLPKCVRDDHNMRAGNRYVELSIKTWLKRYAPKTKKKFSLQDDISEQLELKELRVKSGDAKAELKTYTLLVCRDEFT